MSASTPESAEEISDTERAVYGAVTLPELRAFLSAWTKDLLGGAITEVRFHAGRTNAVWGVELQDGRTAVIKAHRTPVNRDAMVATIDVQRLLDAAGFPARFRWRDLMRSRAAC